jgi:2-polyprenyl-6-methoxyphenol hydroxylase-like FAD-dependent oxidoreductase
VTGTPRVSVIGGSVAGLAAALFLARRGHPVVVLEKDASATPPDVAMAGRWLRRPTPQAAHSHAFLARSRAILAVEAPDVLGALDVAGVRSAVLARARPAGLVGFQPAPGDDELVVWNARRSVFEWVLRRAVEAEPGAELRLGTGVTGLAVDATGTPRVGGVRTDAGTVAAEVVVDASGRRSAQAPPASRDVPCGIAYLSRFYQLRGPEPTPLNRGFTHGASFDRYSCLVFPADNGAFSITFGVLPEDRDLRVLRDPAAFDAAAAAIPAVAPWTDPEVSVPTTEVAVMASLQNLLRCPTGREPLGLHAIGDACCVTNPAHTRGTTLALVAAQRLADVVTEHPADAGAQAAAMARFARDELALWVEDSVGQDAARLARWRPGDAVEQPRWRGVLANGEANLAAQRDPTAWRAFTRLQNTLARPDEVLDDPALAETVARVRASGWSPPPPAAPGHDDLVALARAAAG